MMSVLLRIAVALIAIGSVCLAIAARSEVAQETLYQSYPGNSTAMLRGSRVIALMPQDTEVHHVDTSEGYPHLFPGSCIAAPPAKCVLHPEQVEPMQEAPTK